MYSSLRIKGNKERKNKGVREGSSQNKTKVLRDIVPPSQVMLVICITKRVNAYDFIKENSGA